MIFYFLEDFFLDFLSESLCEDLECFFSLLCLLLIDSSGILLFSLSRLFSEGRGGWLKLEAIELVKLAIRGIINIWGAIANILMKMHIFNFG